MPRQLLRAIAYGFSLILAISVSVSAAIGSIRSIQPMVVGSVLIVVIALLLARGAGALRYQWPVAVLLGLTLGGLVVTGIMTSLADDAGLDSPLVHRVCSAEGQFNRCQQAFQSRWAYLRLGRGPRAIPIPSVLLGVAFYSTLLVWFLVLGRPAPAERWYHLIPLVLTLAASAAAAFFIYVMLTRLGGSCHLCMASHAITFLLLVVTALAWPRRRRGATALAAAGEAAWSAAAMPGEPGPAGGAVLAPYARSWHRPVTTLFAAGILTLLIIQFRMNQSLRQNLNQVSSFCQKITDDPNFMRWDLDRQAVLPIGIQPDDSVRGPEAAPFSVIIYSDFQCPQCKALADRLKEVQEKYPGRLRVAYRHFPLDRSCNRRVKTYMHAFSCQGARAAEAARLLAGNEAFWKMHDAIFAHQDELDVHPYVRLARQIGLNPARFLEEMNGPRALQRIHAQVDGSAAYDVSSTPAVFLNGRPIRSWNSMAFWQAILEVPAAHPSPTTTTRPSGG